MGRRRLRGGHRVSCSAGRVNLVSSSNWRAGEHRLGPPSAATALTARFSRQIPLPARGDPEKAKASFKDGVREVEVPLLQPLLKQMKIEIKSGA